MYYFQHQKQHFHNLSAESGPNYSTVLWNDYIYLFINLLRISEKPFADEAGLEVDLPVSVLSAGTKGGLCHCPADYFCLELVAPTLYLNKNQYQWSCFYDPGRNILGAHIFQQCFGNSVSSLTNSYMYIVPSSYS